MSVSFHHLNVSTGSFMRGASHIVGFFIAAAAAAAVVRVRRKIFR